MTFTEVWIGYAIFGATVFALGFGWAVRQKQFTDMESARHIALKAEKAIEPESQRSPRTHRTDLAGVAGILVTAIAVMVAVLWIGWQHT